MTTRLLARLKTGVAIAGLVAVTMIATIGALASMTHVLTRWLFLLTACDILLVEACLGWAIARQFDISHARAPGGVLPATQIAVTTTIFLFSSVGVALDVLYLVRFGGFSADRLFGWMIAGRWIVLAIVLTPMLLGDQAHQEGRLELSLVQQERLSLIETFEAGLQCLQRVDPRTEERELLSQTIAQVEQIRNRLRGSAFAGVSKDSSRLSQLADLLSVQVETCASGTAEIRRDALVDLQALARQVAREVGVQGLTRIG